MSVEPAGTREITPVDDPPRKRYRLVLTIDAHDIHHLADELRLIANDAEIDGLPQSRISSGGYHFEMEDLGPDRTREAYESELYAWADRRRDARRVR